MRKPKILLAVAGAGATALLASSTLPAETPAFDPLFARGANCTPAQAGRPALPASLLQAQAQTQEHVQPPTETRPFQPGQQVPASTAAASPPSSLPLYKDLGKLHLPISTRSALAQAYFDQGIRYRCGWRGSVFRRPGWARTGIRRWRNCRRCADCRCQGWRNPYFPSIILSSPL